MRQLTRNEVALVAGGWFLASEMPPGAGTGGGIGSTVKIGGSVLNAMDWGKVAAGLHNLTYTWGLQDINYYRTIGGHVPYAQGSLINWGGRPSQLGLIWRQRRQSQ